MGKYFGTDGFRAEAGRGLTAERAFALGRALGSLLVEDRSGAEESSVSVAIGKDTRRSSYMLEYAVASGLASVGVDAYMLHVCTTPAVSFTVRSDGFDAGVMISASHNPYYDNGIKVVDSLGQKISDSFTERLEEKMDDPNIPSRYGREIGRIVDHYGGRNRYLAYLISLVKHSFKGYRIGLDTANGSAWMIAPAVFQALGATTVVIGNEPDGLNINRGVGSTDIEALRRTVLREGLDCGFAFDGDGDRCIAVDGEGREINGDTIAYILAKGMKGRGELLTNTVVTTVMSNLGLYRALDSAGIAYCQTPVGDRFLYERMSREGHSIGAEQSGHVLMSKYSVTGDGILTALMLMEEMLDTEQSLAQLASPVKMLPQYTENIRVKDRSLASSPRVQALADSLRRELGDDGRILLRASGTEPLIRVMTEAPTQELCRRYCRRLATLIAEEDAL